MSKDYPLCSLTEEHEAQRSEVICSGTQNSCVETKMQTLSFAQCVVCLIRRVPRKSFHWNLTWYWTDALQGPLSGSWLHKVLILWAVRKECWTLFFLMGSLEPGSQSPVPDRAHICPLPCSLNFLLQSTYFSLPSIQHICQVHDMTSINNVQWIHKCLETSATQVSRYTESSTLLDCHIL